MTVRAAVAALKRAARTACDRPDPEGIAPSVKGYLLGLAYDLIDYQGTDEEDALIDEAYRALRRNA